MTVNKVIRKTLRLTPEQERRTELAAALESQRRQAVVKPSTLIRDLAMPEIDRIISEAEAA